MEKGKKVLAILDVLGGKFKNGFLTRRNAATDLFF